MPHATAIFPFFPIFFAGFAPFDIGVDFGSVSMLSFATIGAGSDSSCV